MKRVILLAVCVCFFSTAAYAEGFKSLLESAEAAYLNGNQLEAVENLKDCILSIWDEVPLTAKDTKFVTDLDTYTTRPNNVYAVGEKIYLVTRLLGYKLKKVGQIYAINIGTDFYVADESGEVLGGQQNFGQFDLQTPLPVTDFRLDLPYTVTGAPPGVYVLQTVVHDKNSDKSTRFEEKITIQ